MFLVLAINDPKTSAVLRVCSGLENNCGMGKEIFKFKILDSVAPPVCVNLIREKFTLFMPALAGVLVEV